MEILHYKWRWTLQSSPRELWPLLSNTDHFNRDLGLPEIETLAYSDREPRFAVKSMRLKMPFLNIEWEEYPFEWTQPHSFGVERIYQRGPFKSFKVLVELNRLVTGGTQLEYAVWVQPSNLLGKWIAHSEIGKRFPKKVAALLQRYDDQVKKDHPENRLDPEVPLNLKKLADFSEDSSLKRRFAFWLEKSPGNAVKRIRPYALAKLWNVGRQDLLNIFLLATEKGILNFQWEIICPHCRGSEKAFENLNQIESKNYCHNCNTNFIVNFDKLVELTFQPNPSIRKINRSFFCTGGPQVSPHIVSQILLTPGEEKKTALHLEEGVHRIRVARSPLQTLIHTAENGSKTVAAQITSNALKTDSDFWHPVTALSFKNNSSTKQLLVIESLGWAEDAVNARDVIHVPLFRDLFSTQCLRPGERISFGNLTFVFTDLKGSTRLYQEIGDPAAFEKVIDHFDILRDVIREHEGILVKTIGDAVMAVFNHPAQALLAVASAQRHLNSPGRKPLLLLKAGIHYGPALGVTLNQKLDYFGTSVNIAARLVSLSSGSDIVLSASTAEDPQIQMLISTPAPGTRYENFKTTIKGFGEESFSLLRFIPHCGEKTELDLTTESR